MLSSEDLLDHFNLFIETKYLCADFINFINDCIEDQVSQYIFAIDAAAFFCQAVALGERYFFGEI